MDENSATEKDKYAAEEYGKHSKSGMRKLRAVQAQQDNIREYVKKNPTSACYKDFSKAAVAIVREAR